MAKSNNMTESRADKRLVPARTPAHEQQHRSAWFAYFVGWCTEFNIFLRKDFAGSVESSTLESNAVEEGHWKSSAWMIKS
jgi:hypothetical protein